MDRLSSIHEADVPALVTTKISAERYQELWRELMAAAERLGVTVRIQRAAKGRIGWYDEKKNQVNLNYRVGMTRVERLHTLAHELRHAQHNAENLFDAKRYIETYWLGDMLGKACQSFKQPSERRDYCNKMLSKLKINPMNPYLSELDCDRWAFHWLLRRGVWYEKAARHVYSRHNVPGTAIMSLSGRDGSDQHSGLDETQLLKALNNRPHDRLERSERRYYMRLFRRLRLAERANPYTAGHYHRMGG